jgi:pimeloyl-ACP methyl ester carboxylesterase
MAASGVHPKRVEELHAISDYFEPLMEFMTSLPPEERVILVGHSMGGLSNSVAMERFPEKISCAVFAACIMPGPDLSFTAAKEEVSFALFFFPFLSSHTDTEKIKSFQRRSYFFLWRREGK